MPGATPTTLANIVKPFVHTTVSKQIFYYKSLLGLFRQVGPMGGSTFDVLLQIAGNSSVETYVRGQAVPDAGYQQFLTVQATPKNFRGFDQLDGESRRQLMTTWNNMSWPNAVTGQNLERLGLLDDLRSLIEQTFTVDTAEYAISGIIDDATTNYYNTSRGGYEAIRSLVIPGGAVALTFDLLDRLVFGLSAQRGRQCNLLLMGETQARRYTKLMREAMTPTAMAPQSADPNMLPDFAPGVMVRLVPGLPSTLVLGLSGLNAHWAFVLREAAPGGIDLLEYGVTNDSKISQLSTSGWLICDDPFGQGRIENLAVAW